MQVIYARCAGIDIHKRMIVIHLRIAEEGNRRSELRQFGTFTGQLLEMRDWLSEQGVTHIAMESTGSFWRPIYNILEGDFEIVLCNPAHMRNGPGRKTDVKDAEWIADLLAHGLLKPSFVPDPPQRALRDLTRARTTFVSEKARICNRIQKLLEEANIKLASVATDILGVSGRDMLRLIAQGETDPLALAAKARGRLKNKAEELKEALRGQVRPHQRFLLGELLKQVDSLDESIQNFEAAIDALIANEEERPFDSAVTLAQTMPGIGPTSAKAIVSEIGIDMNRFGSAKRLCAWAGVAPGNKSSAGKLLSARTLQGNKSLMKNLAEVAASAARQKGTYHSALFGRICARRGKRRALVAVAHAALNSLFHMIQRGTPYQDLGAEHFDKLNQKQLVRNLEKRAAKLGFALQPAEVSAT